MAEPTLFVCYALEREHLSELRERFNLIRNGAAAAGYVAYFHVHDGQNWVISNTIVRDVLQDVFEVIERSDAVLLDLTVCAAARRTGLNIEAGYAKALGKPIVALWRRPDRPVMTTELADAEASYDQIAEIPMAVESLLSEISQDM